MTLNRCKGLFYIYMLLCDSSPGQTDLVNGTFNPAHSCISYKCTGSRLGQPCSCDDLCLIYGDCCPNHTGVSSIIDQSEPDKNLISCWDTMFGPYFLVTMCPAEWTDRFVREMCETQWPGNRKEYLIPVTSSKSVLSYKNLFCAYCNGQMIRDLKYWFYEYTCHHGDPIKTDLSFEEVIELLLIHKCSITVIEKTRRGCLPNILGCNANVEMASDDMHHIRNLCYGYVDYIGVRSRNNFIVYKNRYCMQCSENISTVTTSCVNMQFLSNKHTSLSAIARFSAVKTPRSPNISMTLEKEVNCNDHYIAFAMKCYYINCPFSYYLSDNKCVPEKFIRLHIVLSHQNMTNLNLPKYRKIKNKARLYMKIQTPAELITVISDLTMVDPNPRYDQIKIETHSINKDNVGVLFGNCTSVFYTGTASMSKTVATMKVLVNTKQWPWYVYMRLTRRERGTDAEMSVCERSPVCPLIMLKRGNVPMELVNIHQYYTVTGKVGVCAVTMEIYNAHERAARNRHLHAFLTRQAEMMEAGAVNEGGVVTDKFMTFKAVVLCSLCMIMLH